MPRARNASFGTSEKVTVAIGSTSSNMRRILACGWGIGQHLLCSRQPWWAASHRSYERPGPETTTPADINPTVVGHRSLDVVERDCTVAAWPSRRKLH